MDNIAREKILRLLATRHDVQREASCTSCWMWRRLSVFRPQAILCGDAQWRLIRFHRPRWMIYVSIFRHLLDSELNVNGCRFLGAGGFFAPPTRMVIRECSLLHVVPVTAYTDSCSDQIYSLQDVDKCTRPLHSCASRTRIHCASEICTGLWPRCGVHGTIEGGQHTLPYLGYYDGEGPAFAYKYELV